MLAPADDLVRPQARLPYPYRDEIPVVRDLADRLTGCLDWDAIVAMATPWVEAVRRNPAPFWAMESLLREYPITTTEGLALMRLAEALLRVPDTETAIALTADQLGRAGFEAAHEGPHRVLAQLSASAIALSMRLLPEGPDPPGLLQRLGAQTVVAATVRAIQLLGRQFVLGREIGEAMAEAAAQRGQPAVAEAAMTADQPITGGSLHRSRLRFSYDMLGEGARTGADAQRYFAAYRRGIEAIGGGRIAASPQSADGISIKLSALFARFEEAQRGRVFGELLPRIC